MIVLVINCGSSSVKYEVFQTHPEESLASGLADRVMANSGRQAALEHRLASGAVHRIEANTEPFSTALISSEGDIIAVLELNAGEAARIGLRRGDRAIYPGLGQ